MPAGGDVCGRSRAVRNDSPTVALTHALRDRPQAFLRINDIYVGKIIGEQGGHCPRLSRRYDKGNENTRAAYYGGSEFVGQSVRVRIMRIEVAAIKQTRMAICGGVRGRVSLSTLGRSRQAAA